MYLGYEVEGKASKWKQFYQNGRWMDEAACKSMKLQQVNAALYLARIQATSHQKAAKDQRLSLSEPRGI